MKGKAIAFVIPVRNRKAFTRACLASLASQTVRDFAVIIIDDGSTDGTPEMITREFPWVTLLRGDGNLWWSGATNLGVRLALAEGVPRIVTLNDDTEAEPDFVAQMLRWSEREPRALLGALALDRSTRQVVFGGDRISWPTASYITVLDKLPADQRKGLHEVTHYPGRGLLIPSEVFGKIGLFAARIFPQTMADYDFTHHAARAGFSVYCNYDARLLIYPEESDAVALRRKKSWTNYYTHLFGIKGGGNLRFFVNFAVRNCPPKYLASYLFTGFVRRVGGYLRDWVRDPWVMPRH